MKTHPHKVWAKRSLEELERAVGPMRPGDSTETVLCGALKTTKTLFPFRLGRVKPRQNLRKPETTVPLASPSPHLVQQDQICTLGPRNSTAGWATMAVVPGKTLPHLRFWATRASSTRQCSHPPERNRRFRNERFWLTDDVALNLLCLFSLEEQLPLK